MSDQFWGPRALAGPAGDIVDVYAFPSPERPGRLVLAMDVHPLASLTTTFSDAIVYRFRLRPVTIARDRPAFPFGPADSELTFACRFDLPEAALNGSRPAQNGHLTGPSGETVRFRVDDERGDQLHGMRVFAGLRSDPFFIDLPAYMQSISTARLAFAQPGHNTGTS